MCKKGVLMSIAGLALLAGCTTMNPQQTARQQAEAYYGRSYDQLDPQEKMRLENHLARHDTTAWHTTARVASGLGRLLQGVGILVLSTSR